VVSLRAAVASCREEIMKSAQMKDALDKVVETLRGKLAEEVDRRIRAVHEAKSLQVVTLANVFAFNFIPLLSKSNFIKLLAYNRNEQNEVRGRYNASRATTTTKAGSNS